MPYRPNFPIPTDIYAEPFCLCIQVPNDPVWKQVVAGLLDELNQWFNWQRDDARSGRECAQVWRELYAAIDWSEMSCCCDSTNPPQYQYSTTGVLQVSVDGGLTYTNSPNADVRNNSPKFPPIEGDDGDDKKCAAATGAANLVKEQVGDQLTDDMGRYTLNNLISDWTHTMVDTSNPFTALVTVVANQLFALVISAVRAALTDTVYHLFACALYCNMGDDASFDDSQWAAARSMITDTIGGVAGVFLEHLIYLLGRTGTTNLVRNAPDDTGDCSDCGCPEGCSEIWIVHTPEIPYVTLTQVNDHVLRCAVEMYDGVHSSLVIFTGDNAVRCHIHDITQSRGATIDFSMQMAVCDVPNDNGHASNDFSHYSTLGLGHPCTNGISLQWNGAFTIDIDFEDCP